MKVSFERRLLAALTDSTPAFSPRGRQLARLIVFEALVYAWLCVICAWLSITLVADHIVIAIIVAIQAVLAGCLSFANAYRAKTYYTRRADQ